jgi:protein-arginine kinase activator protein McsA
MPASESDLEKKIEELTATVPTPGGGSSNYAGMSDEELNESLQDALEHEDYERAARIRDELNKRQ